MITSTTFFFLFLLPSLLAIFFLPPSIASQPSRYYKLSVDYQSIVRLGERRTIVSVNGQFPGPTIYVREGERLLIDVTNHVQYNLTMHWHGIKQFRTGWFDGPAYITQCPLQQGQSFLYNFTVQGQTGTVWWHAHITWLRATVHGAFVILPKSGKYPFPQPFKEVPIVLAEWYNANVEDVLAHQLAFGAAPNISDAFMLNGRPGPLIDPTDSGMELKVQKGKTYMLRLVNAAMIQILFFGVAGHKLTVVSIDAAYTKAYETNVIVLTPGQTTDVLLTASQKGGVFYMSARAYMSSSSFGRVPFDNKTAAGIVRYIPNINAKANNLLPPQTVVFPPFNATDYVTSFTKNLRSLHNRNVPTSIDRNLLMTVSIGVLPCELPNGGCTGPLGKRLGGSINNISFARPTTNSLLQAYYYNQAGIFADDFPDSPQPPFNYTGQVPLPLWFPSTATRVSRIPFGSNVQIVFQNTAILSFENHPMHLHGYNFFVVGEGFGNYDPTIDPQNFNLVDPPERNTVGVPTGGWTAIRFKADNPGVWLLHCHLEHHSVVGLETALIVHNGKCSKESLIPPPSYLPKC